MWKPNSSAATITAIALTCVIGCQQQAPPPAANAAAAPVSAPTATFNPVASIQNIMALEVDPSADTIWAAVSIDQTKSGIKENHPHTNQQWEDLRGRALMLIEATNLLTMDNRRVAREGDQKLDDEGTQGNLSAEQSQQAIDANRSVFIGFAKAMGVVGEQMLKAIDAKKSSTAHGCRRSTGRRM